MSGLRSLDYEIGQKIRLARREIGWSQKDLATLTKIHRPTISLLERGGQSIDFNSLYKIAYALGIAPSDLVPEDFGKRRNVKFIDLLP